MDVSQATAVLPKMQPDQTFFYSERLLQPPRQNSIRWAYFLDHRYVISISMPPDAVRGCYLSLRGDIFLLETDS